MVQPVGDMALGRLGKCCRSLLYEPSKGVFYGVLQLGWIEGCIGGKTNKSRQQMLSLLKGSMKTAWFA